MKTRTMPAYLPAICHEYAPYNTFPAFERGYADYQNGTRQEFSGIDAQAYDRGRDAAMRVARWSRQNVGSN